MSVCLSVRHVRCKYTDYNKESLINVRLTTRAVVSLFERAVGSLFERAVGSLF